MAKLERARGNLSIRIEASIKRKLEKLAKADDDRPVSSYVRKVLKNHVEGASGKED
jgi:predicted DNA-binding protein